MSSTFLCHCNHIAVPAVIEGSTVLVCRHLLQGSQYRTDPHHVPCRFRLEETDFEYEPTVRARVLHRKPMPFKALPLPAGSDPLDLYLPKNELAASRALAEDCMEIDDMPIDGTGQFVLEHRPPTMDLRAWQRRSMILERRLKDAEAELARMKKRMLEMEEEWGREKQVLVEAYEERLGDKDGEADYYRTKYQGARTELHDLRRSTRMIVSSALKPTHGSSPNPI